MPEPKFISTYTNSLPSIRKMHRSVRMLQPDIALAQGIGTVAFLLLCLVGGISIESSLPLILCFLWFLLFCWTRYSAIKTHYHRSVQHNADHIQEVEICITADRIIEVDAPVGNRFEILLTHVRRIGETREFLQLLLDHHEFIVLPKATLTGGSVEELKSFLLENCRNLRKKRIIKPHGYHIRRALLLLSIVLFLTISAVVGITTLPQRTLMDSLFYQQLSDAKQTALLRTLTPMQAAEKLQQLGFGPIAEERIEETKTEVESEYGNDNPLTALLAILGTGRFDLNEQEIYEWTPFTEDLFCINAYSGEWDAFADADESVYLDILQGVSQISSDDFALTDLRLEKQSRYDLAGIRISTVSFSLNGQPHTLTGKTTSPWIDLQFLNDLAALLRTTDNEKQLYFAVDDYQYDIFLFYRDAAWAAEFEQATGLQLFTEFTME